MGTNQGVDKGINMGTSRSINVGTNQGVIGGIEEGDNPLQAQGIEETEESSWVCDAFWQLLHNAGYETW